MKKKIAKLVLKTDKIMSLSKEQNQHVVGGMRRDTAFGCTTKGYCPTEP